jgi:hypothetical protein
MLLCEVVAGQQGILKRYATRVEKYTAILQEDSYRISLTAPLYDKAKQSERFGPFSFRKAVIPFVQSRVDLRFVDAFNGKITPEAKALQAAKGNVIILGTSASGKTRTIFDVARRKFMIYVACLVNSDPQKDRAPWDVEATGDKVFTQLCASIRANVQNT